MRSVTFQGAPSAIEADFLPISQLFRPDGDFTLIFLSGNGVLFNGPMDDDWYVNFSENNYFFQVF
jgi:hypothetical protein